MTGTGTCLCFLLLVISSATAEDVNSNVHKAATIHLEDTGERLARIEDALANVLKKNTELETRIEALEDENKRLKWSIELLKKPEHEEQNEDSSAKEETGDAKLGDDKTPNRVQKKISRRQHVGSIVKRSNDGRSSRVLMSNDPTIAFTVTVSSWRISNLGAGQSILYDRIITNMGGAYHSVTGIFTAPVGGVYVFSVETMVEPGNSQYLELVLNGSGVIPIYTHGTGENRFESSCRIATLKVKAGDEVWVRTYNYTWHGDGIVHGNNYSSFSGWMIAIIE